MKWLELKLPPVVIVLLSLIGMYYSRDIFPVFPMPPDLAKWFAIIIAGSAVVFAGMALYAFRKHATSVNPHAPHHAKTLVTTGVFAVSRNPMYVALIMLIAAAGVYWMHAGVVLFVIVSMLYLQQFQIKPEERILEEKFGDAFNAYLKSAPRWF